MVFQLVMSIDYNVCLGGVQSQYLLLRGHGQPQIGQASRIETIPVALLPVLLSVVLCREEWGEVGIKSAHICRLELQLLRIDPELLNQLPQSRVYPLAPMSTTSLLASYASAEINFDSVLLIN